MMVTSGDLLTMMVLGEGGAEGYGVRGYGGSRDRSSQQLFQCLHEPEHVFK